MEREVGGGIGMGKTCKLKDISFQCMTKFTTNLKKKKMFKKKKKFFEVWKITQKLVSHWVSERQKKTLEAYEGFRVAGNVENS